MHAHQRPPTLGVVAALTYVLAALAPYVLLEVETSVLEVYYAAGLAGPNLLSLFALVAVVLFAAGRQTRTEPDLVAGVTLVLGLVLLAVTALWAVSVPESVVFEPGADWFVYHRWLTTAISAVIPAAAVWYARTLDLV
ncbi:DUF7548 family protein [Natronosalvus halobius]|uniref:DUF7548 family protein n=1 Tax=Natronosalvus halobius TaxID=2953746 RepID=UPI0020A18E87|nr:hypothetical protein [Natronosalvus halobius]USZ73080.1 hypothetical protein NGM15_07190 [Natronosalvus halobius]